MKVYYTAVLTVSLTLSAMHGIALGQRSASDKQQLALDRIASFADRICLSTPLQGKSRTTELSAQAKAELSRLLKQLADIGVKADARYKSSEYEGLLQEHLASAIKAGQECRLAVFRELKDQLLPPPTSPISPQSQVPQQSSRSTDARSSDPGAKAVFSSLLDPPSIKLPEANKPLDIDIAAFLAERTSIGATFNSFDIRWNSILSKYDREDLQISSGPLTIRPNGSGLIRLTARYPSDIRTALIAYSLMKSLNFDVFSTLKALLSEPAIRRIPVEIRIRGIDRMGKPTTVVSALEIVLAQ